MTLPEQLQLPLDEELIKSTEAEDHYEYLSRLVIRLQDMYEDLVDVINGDIEEFTPTLKDTDTDATYTYTNQSGWYLRQGLLVDFWFDVEWSAIATGTPTGNLYIELPYQVFFANQMPFSNALQTSTVDYAGGSILSINAIPSTFRGEIWTSTSAATTANISANTTAGRLMGHIRYVGDLNE